MVYFKNIRDSWEEVKISTLIEVWKKLIPTLMDDFEESFSGESDYRCGEIARELELEVEPEDVAEPPLQSHDDNQQGPTV